MDLRQGDRKIGKETKGNAGKASKGSASSDVSVDFQGNVNPAK